MEATHEVGHGRRTSWRICANFSLPRGIERRGSKNESAFKWLKGAGGHEGATECAARHVRCTVVAMTKRMTEEQFLERLIELGPFADREEAREAAVSTLGIFGKRLYPNEAGQLAEDLPEIVGRPLMENAKGVTFGPDEFFTEVAWEKFAPAGLSVEQARVICGALAEALPQSKLQWLQELVPEMVALLVPPQTDYASDLRAAG